MSLGDWLAGYARKENVCMLEGEESARLHSSNAGMRLVGPKLGITQGPHHRTRLRALLQEGEG
jgi:hypothetical protein